jgi:hypothetical protein
MAANKKLKIYYLAWDLEAHERLKNKIDYAYYAHCFVVRADSEREARKLADDNETLERGNTQNHIWLYPKITYCIEVGPGPPEILCVGGPQRGVN